MANSVNTVADRVRLPLTFDANRMLNDIEALQLRDFIYYQALPLRSPAHLVDFSLPAPPMPDDYADGTWTDWMDTRALKDSPYLSEVVDTFKQHTRVTLVRLLRLAPYSVVKEHTDPTLGIQIEKSVVRLTIPILVPDEVTFYLNRSPVPMQPGECWYLRLTDIHSITNNGPNERINMTIDMEPNDWVKGLIMNA